MFDKKEKGHFITSAGTIVNASSITDIETVFNTDGFKLGNLTLHAEVLETDFDNGTIDYMLDCNVNPIESVATVDISEYKDELKTNVILRRQLTRHIGSLIENAIFNSINYTRLQKELAKIPTMIDTKYAELTGADNISEENFEDTNSQTEKDNDEITVEGF
jgi:hypothetical protein